MIRTPPAWSHSALLVISACRHATYWLAGIASLSINGTTAISARDANQVPTRISRGAFWIVRDCHHIARLRKRRSVVKCEDHRCRKCPPQQPPSPRGRLGVVRHPVGQMLAWFSSCLTLFSCRHLLSPSVLVAALGAPRMLTRFQTCVERGRHPHYRLPGGSESHAKARPSWPY